MDCLATNIDDLMIRIRDACVEIPLRGMKYNPNIHDPRIRKNKRGAWVIRALDGVSLEVRRGERVGIIGGNGNGKTTLLKLIGGMLPTTSGYVEVRGTIRTLLSIGAGTIPALSGRHNAEIRYSLLGVKSLTMTEFVEDVAEFAELGAFFDMPVGTYSPGMQSRLQFAMSTVEPADILLMDEWIGVADQHFQVKANARLEQFVRKNEGFILASHNAALLRRMTERTIEVQCGKIVADTHHDDEIAYTQAT